ncbi:serine hydrolase domain-containing protein [Streptacidiphilus cavernicola]|uniref:Serine hydrolase domain-containing protein n=1 Tax=Streptacidiphilus cavernicola TaxID=3342716 RepID=A0ABV6VYT1_9ACTN
MLDGLGDYCAELLAEHAAPSVSVAVVERGEVAFAGAYGVADVAAGRPAGTGTAYGLGSITKPVTATAVCLAADEGMLDLDAPVPGHRRAPHPAPSPFPAPTVRQLLQHRGGFDPFYCWDYGDGAPLIDPDRYAVPQQAPGVGFLYANLGYRILGQLLESATGQPLGAYVRERVFEPLGLASGHLGPSYPGPAPAAVRYTVDGRAYPDYDCGHPGATLGWATATDLARFAQSYHRLLKPETAAATLEALPLNRHQGYGLGWSVSLGGDGPVLRSHGGGGGGTAAMVVAVAELGLSVAVLSNTTDKTVRDAVLRRVMETLVPGYTPDLISTVVDDPARPLVLPPGVWVGRISAPERDIPIELRVLADRRTELRVEGLSATATAGASAAWDLRVTLPLQLPTADARIASPALGLVLRRDGDEDGDGGRLSGNAYAFKDGDAEGLLGNFLSHPCALDPA